MQKILALVGAAALFVAALYFAVITPIKKYSSLSSENYELQKQLNESRDEVQRVYKQFDTALKYHLNDSTITAIYNDQRFFTTSESEIKVTKEDNYQAGYASYRN